MTLPQLAVGLGRLVAPVLLLAVPALVCAQSTGSPMATVVRLRGSLSDSLPADSTEQALGFFPGVGINDVGQLVIRGGQPHGHAVYLDGVPVAPGYRSAGTQFASGGSRLGIAPNAFAAATLMIGVPAAAWGNGASAILAYDSPRSRSYLGGTIRYGTDEVIGAAHGLGINRIEGAFGGPIASGLSFEVAGVLMGQRSAETGAGSNGTPIFVRGGADTVVKVPSTIGSPTADTMQVEVSRFLQFRGDCDAFSGSPNQGIASNYGTDCTGVRNPADAVSTGQVLGTVRYRIDPRHAVWATVAASQEQRRLFDYVMVNVPQQIPGERSTSRVLTLGFAREIGRGFLGAGVRAALSFQLDQNERGPLTAESDADTWDPWGGFLLAPLHMLYGLETFPIDEELVENYRLNKAHSRRSPYDLENSDQYELISNYRTNAYALSGFPEGGGPDGRLALRRERRAVGIGRLTWRLPGSQELSVGGEFTDYGLTNYSHDLTSQAFSDVYIESPSLLGAFLQDHLRLGSVTIDAGLRYDRFSSGAERPYLLDLNPTSPTFDEYVPFPRPASYRQNNNTAPDGRPLTIFRRDDSHSAVSPRVRVGAVLTGTLAMYFSAGRLVQAPDFAAVYAGVNTDLSITNTLQTFGDDLGFQTVNLAEVGLQKRFGGLTLHGAVYVKDWDNLVRPTLRTLQDPLNGRAQDLRLYTDDESQSATGFEVGVAGHIGGWVHGLAAYSLADAEGSGGFVAPDVRPHTVSGILEASAPQGWREGTLLGDILRNLSLTGAYRFASGTAYTRCPDESGNAFLVTGDACALGLNGEFNGARLPSIKQIDLRLSKGFEVGSTSLSAFLDVRNLLDADRVRQVFLVTGTTENAEARDEFAVGRLEGYANEGSRNGALLADGTLNMTFGTGGCTDWVTSAGTAAAPNCVYLIRAEQRFGNGDGMFTMEEQERTVDAYYRTQFGRSTFLGAPRRIRLGVSVGL